MGHRIAAHADGGHGQMALGKGAGLRARFALTGIS
jgi:hypothetical protein